MKVSNLKIPDLKLITPEAFHDERGYFFETYRQDDYQFVNETLLFRQDNCSHSTHGVLRGLHYQLMQPQAKLVSVIRGEIFDVAVDLRKDSATFGQWVSQHLDDKHHQQLFIPAGFAHGFLVLSNEADVYYKCSTFYNAESERGIHWQDPSLNISWPFQPKLISKKDASFPGLQAISSDELPHLESKS